MLKGWLHPPAQSVSTPDPENFSGASGSSSTFFFTSAGSSRDAEVSITGNGPWCVYLRYGSGNAIAFQQDGVHFTVRCESGISASTAYNLPVTSARSYLDAHLSAGATYVVGVSGFDVYVKVNGTEVIRFKEWRICLSGKVAVKLSSGQTISAGTVTFLPDATLHSRPQNRWFDPRDLGAKLLAPTKGSISALSSTLTVADPTGYAIGDFIIVETDGDSGVTPRGGAGVGGVWPALSYANASAMNADGSKATNTWCYLVDTGVVYRWSGASWAVQTPYYYAKAVPRALTAQITGISGNDLTLSVAATVAATNANVYFDSTPAFMYLTTPIYYGNGNDDFTPWMSGDTLITIPDGTFYLGGEILMRSVYSGRIAGVGATSVLQSPKGCPPAFVNISAGQTGKRLAYNFKMVGNCRDTGFGLGWNNSWIPYGGSGAGMVFTQSTDGGHMTAATSAIYFNSGVLMTGCVSCSAENITSVDIFQRSIGMSSCTDCWGRNSTTTYTQGLRQYIQWSYQYSDGTGGGFENISVSCAGRMVAGAEIFRSTGSVINGFTGLNASLSANSAGAFTYTNCAITITVTDNDSTVSDFDKNNPLININDNIGGGYVAQGGSIVNATMVQSAYCDANNNSFKGITVNINNQDITITGGSYSAPDYHVGSDELGALGINSTGSHTVVTGFTVTGKAKHEVSGGTNLRNIDLRGGGSSSANGTNTANEIYVNP